MTARLSRIGAHLARRQEAIIQPVRSGTRRGRTAERSAHRGAAVSIVPTRLAQGIDAVVRGRDEPDRSTRAPRPRRVVSPIPTIGAGSSIELTEAGLEIVDAAVAANAVSDRQLLDRLDPGEITALEEILRKLLGGLELPG